VPTRERLEDLGLHEVAGELEKMEKQKRRKNSEKAL
jgi:hypothetical protein